jgi:hypothetical protein
MVASLSKDVPEAPKDGKFYSRKDGSWSESPGVGSGTGVYDKVQYNPAFVKPAWSEGLAFYDQIKKAFSYYNDESDVTVNLGQEILIRVKNNTGSTITNGSIVYPSGVDSGEVTIGLADAHVKSKSRLVAMATHDIETGTIGYVTRFGEVSDVDTSLYAAGGILYLSSTTPGAFTDSPPDDGSYVVIIGAVKIVGVSGSIVVDPTVADVTVEVTDTNGFPPDQRTATTLSFIDGTRTFTIAPTGSMFHFYELGDKYEKESSESIVISNVEGLHLIYYDAGALTDAVNPNDGQADAIIRTKCLVAYLYWDATNSELIYLGDERHGISMAPETHSYLHFTRGAQYLSGLAIGDLNVSGDGNTNSHAQFSVAGGITADEDLITVSSNILSTTGLPIYYLDGSTPNLRQTTKAGFSVLDDVTAGVGVTGRLVYNKLTTGTWSLETVTNGDFVLCHVFQINGYTGEAQQIAFIGNNQYSNAVQARAGAATEISTILSVIPIQERVPIGTVILQTGDGYLNDVKARARPADDGDYVDWRVTDLAQGVAATAHGNLTGLANDDHSQYLLLAGRSEQTIDFTTYPTLISGYKSGTLASPPSGLAIGERWADTTDSATHPIIRISTVTT